MQINLMMLFATSLIPIAKAMTYPYLYATSHSYLQPLLPMPLPSHGI